MRKGIGLYKMLEFIIYAGVFTMAVVIVMGVVSSEYGFSMLEFGSESERVIVCIDRQANGNDQLEMYDLNGNHLDPKNKDSENTELRDIAAGDFDGDGGEEVVAISHSDSATDTLAFYTRHKLGKVQEFDAASYNIVAIAAGDFFEPAGVDEIVVADGNGNLNFYDKDGVLTYPDGANKVIYRNNRWEEKIDAMDAGDIDGDSSNGDEIAILDHEYDIHILYPDGTRTNDLSMPREPLRDIALGNFDRSDPAYEIAELEREGASNDLLHIDKIYMETGDETSFKQNIDAGHENMKSLNTINKNGKDQLVGIDLDSGNEDLIFYDVDTEKNTEIDAHNKDLTRCTEVSR